MLQGQGVAALGAVLLGGDAAGLEGLEEEEHRLVAHVRCGRGGLLGVGGGAAEAGGGEGAGGQPGAGLAHGLAAGAAGGEALGNRVEVMSVHLSCLLSRCSRTDAVRGGTATGGRAVAVRRSPGNEGAPAAGSGGGRPGAAPVHGRKPRLRRRRGLRRGRRLVTRIDANPLSTYVLKACAQILS